MENSSNGIFCISLDFEKYWGVHDILTPTEAENKMLAVKDIVRQTLTIFEKYNIHATWATVGLLFDKDPAKTFEYKKELPYSHNAYSPFPLKFDDSINSEIITANEEIGWILNTAHQELASHSFSHLYALEEGITRSSFIEDIDEMAFVSQQFETELRSIVFPRNQVNSEWLEELSKSNYVAFRGNQLNKLWSNTTYKSESMAKRSLRWKDAYFGKSKTTYLQLNELKTQNGLLNIPASRFLRPAGSNTGLEKRKLNKIKAEMEACAKNNQVYHLWWHPHNFAENQSLAFSQLEAICQHYKKLAEGTGFQSLNMKEIASCVR